MLYTLKFAFRFLYRQKAFSIINILGLALSLACCIILSRYLYRVYNIDSHAIDINSIMVINRTSDINNDIISKNNATDIYEQKFEDDLNNQIIESSHIVPMSDCQIYFNNQSRYINALVIDSLFLHFFDYKIEGDKNAMERPDGCWISRHIISTLGTKDNEIIGQHIEVGDYHFIISGIYEDHKGESTLKPDIMISYKASPMWRYSTRDLFRIKSNADIKSFNERILKYKLKTREERRTIELDSNIICKMITWKDYYYNDCIHDKTSKIINHGNKTLNWILGIVMIIIFVIGIINFVNLYLVYWQRRQSEEGVRRVFGQKAPQLFFELWTELEILVLASVFIAWLFVEISIPWLIQILGYKINYTLFDGVLTIGMLLILPLLTIIYPFFQQLRHSPITSLQQRTGTIQSIKSRTIILAFQYLITFSLLTISLWMQNHLDFLLNSPTGFETEHILLAKPLHIKDGYTKNDDGSMFNTTNKDDIKQKAIVITNKLKESSYIKDVIISFYTPITPTTTEYNFFNDKNEMKKLILREGNSKWFDIFGIPLIKGKFMSDTLLEGRNWTFYEWVVNEKALQILEYNNIEDGNIRSEQALGVSFDIDTKTVIEYGKEPYPIIGLVGDYYSIHRTLGIKPLIYLINDDEEQYSYQDDMLIIKTQPNQEKEAVEYLEKVCKEVCPEETLEYHWFKDDIKDLYKDDKLIANIYSIFSFIAILICCLGLLGISLFDINQRFREIAIRKANGAHRKDLLLLLGKKYFYILISTFVLSIPITYILIHHYTQSFIESAPLTPVIFIVAFVIVLIITTLTLLYQLKKATNVNVAEIIKIE
ncbi:MAG: ABC transporter permease [Bacteroidales bacterium]|nr:ABC transporter permease [Bacteroidales bacterium]